MIWGCFQNVWKGHFLRPLRSKDVQGWILRLKPQNFLASSEISTQKTTTGLCMSIGYKVLIGLSFLLFLKLRLILVSNGKKKYQSQIFQNFGTICYAVVCLTFLRLTARFLKLSKRFWCCSLKIQPWKPFELNGLKNCRSNILKVASINAFVPKIHGSYEL